MAKPTIFDYKNEEGLLPCKHCLKKNGEVVYPKITAIDDCYYAQCPKCTCFDPYEFLSSTKKGAYRNWNDTMAGKYKIV